MKLMSLYAFILLSKFSYGQKDNKILSGYDRFDTLVYKAKMRTANTDELRELQTMAIQIQNQGQIIEERLHNYEMALIKTDSAIIIFITLNDTINEANNRKYKGYLLAKLNDYAKAKEEIARAIELYSVKGRPAGVAVSKFDLARVYDLEGKTDSAWILAENSIAFWRTVNDSLRILTINVLLVHLAMTQAYFSEGKKIIKESEYIISHSKFHWQVLIDSYFTFAQFYQKFDFRRNALKYRQVYDNKIEELKSKGIPAKAYYDSTL